MQMNRRIVQNAIEGRYEERRSIGRTKINRDALLYFLERETVFSCCARDVTISGAGIRLQGLNVLPLIFYLSFDNFWTARSCRLIWREGDLVVVEFET
jgi:hypothetical protein